ncbi:MAG: poly-gamma-glutamate system protein, partial [Deltaproteobacteria bacterium]|nr:poly-gamma-glutamate system protein [Deltaproteobacteria bacterium]
MKKIYWRPHSTPLLAIALAAVFAVGGGLAAEQFRITERSPYYSSQLEAAQLTSKAMAAIKEERLKLADPIDPEADPAQSGLIGTFISPVTSSSGNLEAKQTSINPNFAAVIVDLLEQAGVRPGDRIAVSVTGSFPALNIALYAAIKVLGLKPTIISSVSSSQWGANEPGFLWIDMEHYLYDQGLFPFRSAAASIGGRYDKGKEMSEDGRQFTIQAIEKNGLARITDRTLHENVDQRMSLYYQEGRPQAYINVGGGIAAVGAERRRREFLRTGLQPQDHFLKKGNFVVYRFLREGTPVIHLENIKALAARYGLPVAPSRLPEVGEGGVYSRTRYNKWLAGAVLGGIFC